MFLELNMEKDIMGLNFSYNIYKDIHLHNLHWVKKISTQGVLVNSSPNPFLCYLKISKKSKFPLGNCRSLYYVNIS